MYFTTSWLFAFPFCLPFIILSSNVTEYFDITSRPIYPLGTKVNSAFGSS